MIQIDTTKPFTGFIDSRRGGRPENQDSCGYANTPLGMLVVVCDGMGGGPGGKLASTIAVQIIVDAVCAAMPSDSCKSILQDAFVRAHEALLRKVKEVPSLRGMGTTVVALLINDEAARVAYMGDSRLYQFRHGKKIFRTADHSMVAELVRKGTLTEEQARLSAQSNIITRALGGTDQGEFAFEELSYEAGDRFMLCTDGIWGAMPEKQLMKLSATTSSLAGTVESLVISVDELGFSNGGQHDNFTVAIIETSNDSILKEKMRTKTRNFLLGLVVLCSFSLIGNIIQFVTLTSNKLQQEPVSISVNIDSLVDAKVQEISRKLENKYDSKIDTLTKEISENNYDRVKGELEVWRKESDIVKQLDNILAQLRELRDMKAGKEKQKKRDAAISSVKGMIQILKQCGIKVDEFTDPKNGFLVLLEQPIAIRSDGKAIGHYNSIIGMMSKVKNEINYGN